MGERAYHQALYPVLTRECVMNRRQPETFKSLTCINASGSILRYIPQTPKPSSLL
jgi:hypothetical protein